ncbi:ribosome small subunit-dependent GTPase A [Rhodophyticola sp. CCM32]|uniref:ribosome small subunit-dependent GTPase A n=1 Tax=Rhodophyticola sp. CCM32 TaxID=2916397 RepID=UPI00107FCF02|nr:ribosome small subunit-dependent GTPase A [Rhodophyticola sp. CCM32]QBY02271.1 ribosome small subunit-dependent GTPase A [Rhodophyticola sp. CCM32]
MTHFSLTDLGWSYRFLAQLTPEEAETRNLARITTVARDRLGALTPDTSLTLLPTAGTSSGAYATGDWVIFDPVSARVIRRLEPLTELSRRAAGTGADRQLIASNVDTLGIVSSCNADFNLARLERYLALAGSSGALPLVILTKADLCDDPDSYRKQAARLSPLVTAIALNATDPDMAETLAPWCRNGQTLALLGSSGVGKSTLANALTGGDAATRGIREDDAKGRHTTTARGLDRTVFGGWLIDTPGMRALRLTDAAEGIETVFSDLGALALDCRFSDCSHETEPGCAIQAAIAAGDIDPDRLDRWRKLAREDARNSRSLHEARSHDRALGKMYRSAQKGKRDRTRS